MEIHNKFPTYHEIENKQQITPCTSTFVCQMNIETELCSAHMVHEMKMCGDNTKLHTE